MSKEMERAIALAPLAEKIISQMGVGNICLTKIRIFLTNPDTCPVVNVVCDVADKETGEPTGLGRGFNLVGLSSEEDIANNILSCIIDMALHEALEMTRRNGTIYYDPHLHKDSSGLGDALAHLPVPILPKALTLTLLQQIFVSGDEHAT